MGDYRVALIDANGELEITGMLLNKNIEELKRIKIRQELTPKQKVMIEQQDALKKYSKSLGGYINMHYVRNELLFNKFNIDRANISRLIYLSTYIDYNSNEENLLVMNSRHNQLIPMDKKDIKKVLKLKDSAFFSFVKEIKSLGLLYEVGNKLYLNPEYFNKGKVTFKECEYTRIFIRPTRFLYENCKPKNHKQLSYIFQLIPYMNYETNIVCSNPGEKDFYKLDKLNLTQICEILGSSTNSKQVMNKLKNDLLKFYVVVDDKKYYFLSYVNVQNGFGIKDYFAINPNVIWGGKDVSRMNELIQLMFFE